MNHHLLRNGIAIVNPHNPTGAVFSSREVEEIMNLARDYNLLVIADEIYDNFLYEDADFKSFISFPDWRDHVLYCNGFSKTFSMTGWRLGYLVARREVAKVLTKLAVNTWSCPPSIAQKVGIKALRSDWSFVKEMVSLFDKRRRILYEELKQIKGFEVWGLGFIGLDVVWRQALFPWLHCPRDLFSSGSASSGSARSG